MRLLVIGNSVALYVRPRNPGAKPYGHQLVGLVMDLASEPSCVEIRAGNSLTVGNLLRTVEDRLIAFAPDVVIVNVGIVECTPRVVPQRLRRMYVRGRTSWQRLWLAAETMIRSPVLAITGGAPAMTLAGFGAALQRLVEVAMDESGAKVLCLGLPQTSRRILANVPGLDAHIRSYDAVIRGVCGATGAAYVDVAAIVSREGEENALPDGIHFSEMGHAAIAHEIAGLLRAAEGHGAVVQPRARGPVAAAARTRVPGGFAAIPLTLLALVWVAGVKSIRALRRQRQL